MKYSAQFILLVVLVAGITSCDNPADSTTTSEHVRGVGVVISSSGVTVVRYERDEEVQGHLEATAGELSDHLDFELIGDDGSVFMPSTDTHSLQFEIADTTLVTTWQHADEQGGFEFHLDGKAAGETTIIFRVFHEDHADFTSKAIPVIVNAAPVK
jgi:hypothetical protein